MPSLALPETPLAAAVRAALAPHDGVLRAALPPHPGAGARLGWGVAGEAACHEDRVACAPDGAPSDADLARLAIGAKRAQPARLRARGPRADGRARGRVGRVVRRAAAPARGPRRGVFVV